MTTEQLIIRVLIADDHAQTRLGMRECLNGFEDLDVVGEAATGAQAIDEAVRLHPDVIIMDLAMQGLDGLEAIRRITPDHPGIAIVVLSMYHQGDLVQDVVEAGARGYLLKEADLEELVGAIRATARGIGYYARPIDDKLRGWLSKRPRDPFEGRLSPQRLKVLDLLARGYTNHQIANQVHLALGTVQNLIWEAKKELDCADRTELRDLARRELSLDAEPDPPTVGLPGQPVWPAVECPQCRCALARRER